MRGQKSRAEIERLHDGARLPIARLVARLGDDGGEQEVALELHAGALDGLGCDEERGHRSLVVDDALADELVAFPPGLVMHLGIRIGPRPDVGCAHRGVHVAVEQQAKTAARSG